MEPVAGSGGPSLKGQLFVPFWVIVHEFPELFSNVTLSPLLPFQSLQISTSWSAMFFSSLLFFCVAGVCPPSGLVFSRNAWGYFRSSFRSSRIGITRSEEHTS